MVSVRSKAAISVVPSIVKLVGEQLGTLGGHVFGHLRGVPTIQHDAHRPKELAKLLG